MSKLPENVGKKDAAIRFFLAAVLLAITVYMKPAQPVNWILYGIAIVLALTAQFSFCPIWFVLRIKTNRKD